MAGSQAPVTDPRGHLGGPGFGFRKGPGEAHSNFIISIFSSLLTLFSQSLQSVTLSRERLFYKEKGLTFFFF